MSGLVAKRPTETVTGLGAALAVYGFVTQVGLPELVAAIVAVVVLVVPYLVSAIVDAVRQNDAVVEDLAAQPPRRRGADGAAVLEGGSERAEP